MHILILGATGQIGYELSRVLSKEHTITIMIRGNRKNLAFPDAATLIESASYDEEAMREALEHSDLVVYALGTPAQWLPDRNDFHVNNFLLLKRFLDVLIGTGVRTMVYISTYELFKSIDGYIRESHPLTDAPLHPYYESMLKSYVLMKEYEKRYDLQVITMHPSAVYGGLNTGYGFTNYLCNLKDRRHRQVPFLVGGSFPVVHVHSLASAVQSAIDRKRYGESYIISDQMTSLREMAHALHRLYPKSMRPIQIPLFLVKLGTFFLDMYADRVTRRPPIMTSVQIHYITRSPIPDTGKARAELDFRPMILSAGIERWLRGDLPPGYIGSHLSRRLFREGALVEVPHS